MFPSLEMLHSLPHLTMSLQSVPAQFNLTVAYLQSLTLIVAVLLAMGFTVLVLLALFLCMVISFVQPAIQPSARIRLVAVFAAIGLLIIARPVASGSDQCSQGLVTILDNLKELSTLIRQV